MGSWMFICVCIISVSIFGTVSGVTLTTTPSNIINIGGQNPTQELTVRCRPEAGSATVFEIIIGKRNSFGTEQKIVSMKVGESNPTLEDNSLRTRITLTGSVSGSSAYLEFRLKDPVCSDIESSTLYCISSWSGGGTGEDTRNLTVMSYPGNILFTVTPDKFVYDTKPYTRVEFKCDGSIGSENAKIANTYGWRWEWRINDDRQGGRPGSWTPYIDNDNITYDRPTVNNACQYSGSTVMILYVTDVDNYREIRCYANGEELMDNRTKIIKTDGSGGDSGNPGGSAEGPASANLGLILGVVFGVLAAIIIVVVLVYVFVFRRKSGGDDYDTGEGGKNDRPPMTDNVVYSTPASKDHRGKGRENDGLDEPHAKPYYANDYDRGRSNPAMDDDKHDRSYDDDNTDSRVRSPYGSAV